MWDVSLLLLDVLSLFPDVHGGKNLSGMIWYNEEGNRESRRRLHDQALLARTGSKTQQECQADVCRMDWHACPLRMGYINRVRKRQTSMVLLGPLIGYPFSWASSSSASGEGASISNSISPYIYIYISLSLFLFVFVSCSFSFSSQFLFFVSLFPTTARHCVSKTTEENRREQEQDKPLARQLIHILVLLEHHP